MIKKCRIFKNQPCGKEICCRECGKYGKCGYFKCLNDPNKCEKDLERVEKEALNNG